jgi:ABC-2 type transport system permease protein
MQQWWVLTGRVIAPTLRNGEIFIQAFASVMFTVVFYVPLKEIMGAFVEGMSSYGQYLMPLIALQAVAFAAVSAALRSSMDSVQGINRRFKAMPIAPLVPLASRMSASMYRCVIALAASLMCGHVIGFRFYGGVAQTVGFCLLMLLIGAALSLLGDLIGAANKNPEATVPVLLVPQLVLGWLSVGLQPVERFPQWIQPFVRDQPISQFVRALRALAGDSTPAAGEVTWSTIGPAIMWVAALIAILIPLHGRVASRRQ